MRKSFLLILLPLLTLAACNGPYTPSSKDVFMSREGICMVAGQRDLIDFSSGNIQCEYNPVSHTYRAGVGVIQIDSSAKATVEIVKEYYVLILEKAPSEVGELIQGKFILQTNTIQRTQNVPFEVLKIEKDLMWMWANDIKWGVVFKYTGAPASTGGE